MAIRKVSDCTVAIWNVMLLMVQVSKVVANGVVFPSFGDIAFGAI